MRQRCIDARQHRLSNHTEGSPGNNIEVDAQLQSFNLVLVGHNVSFNNQDLFFQSKSIVEIIQTLVMQSKPDTVTVGVLMLLFVIILPVMRKSARGSMMIVRVPRRHRHAVMT